MRTTRTYNDIEVTTQICQFDTDSCSIVHAMMHVETLGELFEGQLRRMEKGLAELTAEYPDFKVVFGRLFVSDSTNQHELFIQSSLSQYNISFIQQPPLDGSKLALWVYLKKQVSASPYQELWSAGLCSGTGTSYQQTKKLLEDYELLLAENGCNIADQCVRTWFFVRDVDTQYKGMVDARRENFETVGMTNETHYLSSTGIGGLPACVPSLVQMDALAVIGLKPNMQRYLYAKSHLNSTYEYGVTFERGTAVDYPDHSEIYISGTASIDNKGKVLHVGNIIRQTERMLENVSELLNEGGATFNDMAQTIVYLRDIADYATVTKIFAERFPADLPIVFTYAPVCRPTWLIEMECIALVRNLS